MSHIYACLFSNGAIKVGISINPKRRITQHRERVSCLGVDLTRQEVRECVEPRLAEAELIKRCCDAATNQHKREWFEGLDYDLVCKWLDECAAITHTPRESPSPVIAAAETWWQKANRHKPQATDPHEFPEGHIPRYAICWTRGRREGEHEWDDIHPELPHKPDFNNCKWDERPDDWWEVWPQLLNHPCALYYAPKHPKRGGERRFSQWVWSWPAEFNDKSYLDSMTEEEQQIVKEIWPRFVD